MQKHKAPHYEVGMLVEHPKRPEWGPGKVVAVGADRVHVVFRDAMERRARTFMRALVALTEADSQTDAVLDRLPPAVETQGSWLLPVHFDRMIKKGPSA